jgi:hypothetical protein
VVTDNPSVENVTFYYNGSAQNGPQDPVLTFTLNSSIGSVNEGGAFTYQTNGENENGGYTMIDQGQGQLSVPNGVPEPASLSLMGGSLLALSLLSRRLVRAKM